MVIIPNKDLFYKMKTFPDKRWHFEKWIKEGETADFKSVEGCFSTFSASWIESISIDAA